MNQRTAMVMAGGTGGHIFPALAVAERLRTRGWNVVWLGTHHGLESRLVPPHQIEIEWLSVAGLRGKGLATLLLALPRVALALWQALRAMQLRKPQIVLGFGGFVAFPGGIAAALLRRPLLIHEQNSIAGLTNRVLAIFACEVLAGFPDAFRAAGRNGLARLLPRHVVTRWTGNPVRTELTLIPAPGERFAERSGPLRILVVGGSQGARALNAVVPAAIARLPLAQRPLVLHQSGPKLYAEMQNAYAELGVDAEIRPFIDDMASALANADVVLCRAGALTVSELAAVGVGSILIPFPAAVDDHQTRNAQFLVDAGAAVLIPQQQLNAEDLAQRLLRLDRAALLRMATAAHALARPLAAEEVADRAELHALGARRGPPQGGQR